LAATSCRRNRSPVSRTVDDLALLLRGGVVDVDLEQEPVALGFGQRVDALVLDRVLGGHHQERLGQRVGLAADGDLALGHDLQQRGLDFRRRPVDLVGQQEVAHHGPEFDVELLAALAVDPGADDVGGHQVGGELNAGERAADHLGEGFDGQRLGHAGHTFEQHVSLGEQAHQNALEELILADDDPLDLEERPFQRVHLSGQTVTARRRDDSARRAVPTW
jgi:hypothetical protein